MKLHIRAIGKLKKGPEKDLTDLYRHRLRCPVETIEYLPQLNKNEEGTLLLSHLPAGSYIVALDEQGTQLTSLEFARAWQTWQEKAPSALAFIIGGADGLSDDVKKKAHYLWSFGTLTWPHLLVRGLLMEQLYRAQQILVGHPYHRE
jgi:23S rRNA (pseudouridine1915-N3)-methyltransferase